MAYDSARALLENLIDYAGLFPPAALDLTSAVRQYLEHRAGEHAWMLGRFVAPAGRIGEIPRVPAAALLGADLEKDAAAALEAGSDTVELKAETPARIGETARRIPGALTCYFEIPWAADPGDCIRAIAEAGARAKIRTGGLTPSAFPSPQELLRFLQTCVAFNVPFKATAGLHHPVRGRERFMHGFLNVFLAAAFLRAGMDGELVLQLIEEESPAAFTFQEGALEWRGCRLTRAQIIDARHTAGIAFGSCSFVEPVEDLQAMGVI